MFIEMYSVWMYNLVNVANREVYDLKFILMCNSKPHNNVMYI